MAKSVIRTYSRYTLEAIGLLAGMIKLERKRQKLSEAALAERVGISRGMLQRIEKADPKCELGVVFEVSALLGIKLFDNNADAHHLARYRLDVDERLSLMPKRIRKNSQETFDDF